MKYTVQYKNRKDELKLKTLEAPNPAQVRDYIRREGAKDVVIVPAGSGFICAVCGKLSNDRVLDKICDKCRSKSSAENA